MTPKGTQLTPPIASAPEEIGVRTPNRCHHRARRFERGWVLSALILAAIASLATLSPRATAAVYWGSDRDGIGAANLDGSEPQWNYFYAFERGAQGPSCGVAVSSQFLYWAAPGGIVRRGFDGERLYPWTVVPQPHPICGLAFDQSHLYWGIQGPPSTPNLGSLGRANLDGTEATSSFITGLEDPCDVTTGAGHIYWMERDGIGRANLDGTEPERPFLTVPTWRSGCGLTAAAGHLYWGQGDSIARADLEGGEVEPSFIPAVGAVNGIAVQDGYIYWAGRPDNATASIGRASLDGGEANPAWISSATTTLLGGVAVDARPTPPDLTLPSRSIRFAQNVEYNLRSGAALLGVYVPPAGPLALPSPPNGRLSVSSRGLSWKVLTSPVLMPAQGGFSLWKVRLRSGKGRVGRRIRSQLRRRGWAPIKVRLEYTQDRVYPVSETRRVILRRYPGAPKGWVKHPRRPGKKGSR